MGKILFAKQDNVHVLKLVGDVRVTLGPTISNFLDRIKHSDQAIVIDLTETTGIDSTTLGILARVSLQSAQKPTLFSTCDDINRIVSSMGFEQIFVIVHEVIDVVAEQHELPTQMVSESTFRQQVLEAHKTLMSLTEQNHNSFCDLVDALENEQAVEEQGFQARKAS